jgi:hypothetical protein
MPAAEFKRETARLLDQPLNAIGGDCEAENENQKKPHGLSLSLNPALIF